MEFSGLPGWSFGVQSQERFLVVTISQRLRPTLTRQIGGLGGYRTNYLIMMQSDTLRLTDDPITYRRDRRHSRQNRGRCRPPTRISSKPRLSRMIRACENTANTWTLSAFGNMFVKLGATPSTQFGLHTCAPKLAQISSIYLPCP